jgi:hypothetical protein
MNGIASEAWFFTSGIEPLLIMPQLLRNYWVVPLTLDLSSAKLHTKIK